MVDAAGFIPKVNVGSIMDTILIILIIILATTAISVMLWYVIRKRKYKQYRIEVLDTDQSGNVYRTYDRGGVFLDKKTGFRLLFIEKAKIGLNPNNIPYISTLDKKGRIIKTVTIRRIGINNYVYVKYDLSQTTKITIGEEDTNNAAQEFAKIRKTYNKESWLKQMLPIILWVITIIAVMIVVITLINKFSILDTVSQRMETITENQARITEYMYNRSYNIGQPVPLITPSK